MKALKTANFVLAIVLFATTAHAQTDTNWAHVGGDIGNNKYSALDQINARSIKRLKVAWRAPAMDPAALAENPQLVASNNYQDAPLVFDGLMYISSQIGQAEARDPGTGKVIWRQANFPGDGPLTAFRSSRGIAIWGKGAGARIVTVRGPYLYLLDAKTGAVIPSFGDNGRVDMRVNPKDLFYWRSPSPIVVNDVIVIGGQPIATDTPDVYKASLAGDIRGYDVHSGKLLWTFHTVPHEGELGTETWENQSWREGGKSYTWNGFSADEQLGYVYVPLSAPPNDYYGGIRPGDDLFSDSLVALDAKTGKRVWHFQTVHHDLWDYDIPTPPMLADVKVNGRLRKAAIQVTKTAFVFAFDRATGEPLFPIAETPVPASTVPGEKAAKTQPIPVKPKPFDRQGVSEDQLIDFTPELHAEAVQILSHYMHGSIYMPPSMTGGPDGMLGTLYMPGWVGGANWTGAALDPQTGIIYVPSVSVPWVAGVEPDGKGGYRRARTPGGLYLDGPQGLPLVKPPYGRITAIDMNSGDHLWMVPNGDGPRNNPLLKDLNLPPLGQPGRAAPLLTKSFLFLGEGSDAGQSMPKFSGGNMFRAYDKKTGKVVWEIDLGAGTTSPPITYMYKGKQYIVVNVADIHHAPEIVAMSLE
jgi:quinoprotein glucose dehydrogenase